MKRVFVTGASGLIGHAFCRKYGEEFELVASSRTSGRAIDLFAEEREIFSQVEQIRPDVILHLAAYTDVSAAYEQEGDHESPCYRLNVGATTAIARAAERVNAHCIYVSTDFVFDGGSQEPMTEETECNPIEWYGRTKWLGEGAVTESAESWSIARISFPFSLQNEVRPDFVAKVRERLRTGEQAHLFTDQFITPTWIEDIVDGLAALVRATPEQELFHLTGSGSYSPHEFGQLIAEAMQAESSLVVQAELEEYLATDPRPRQKYLIMSNNKWKDFCGQVGVASPKDAAELLRETSL